MQALLQLGRLGELHYLASRWPAYRPSPKARSAWKAEPDPMHGLRYDLGPHLIDQALVLFGAPARVKAQVETRRPGSEVVDLFRILLSYEGGPTVLLEVDHLDPFDPPRFEVRGSRGAYGKHGVDAQEAALRAGEDPGKGPWGEEAPERYGRPRAPSACARVTPRRSRSAQSARARDP